MKNILKIKMDHRIWRFICWNFFVLSICFYILFWVLTIFPAEEMREEGSFFCGTTLVIAPYISSGLAIPMNLISLFGLWVLYLMKYERLSNVLLSSVIFIIMVISTMMYLYWISATTGVPVSYGFWGLWGL